ncbi:retinin [Calliphora vicina]|uniref:retinin n=1 Tax=Calliphora vicina TaxID=7373 RepID=UPI00325B0E79
MLKLAIIIGLVVVCLCEAAISSLQLVVPNDPYSVLTGGKSSSTSLGNSIPSLSNAISDEDKSSKALSEESNESAANSAASSAPSPQPAAASSPTNSPAGSAPAALTRIKPSSALSSITSSAGLSRGSLLISSTAQASASAGSPGSSSRSTATIQHRILPAESIPLPITISTRPGLRTVIAPETITIQQPSIAKVGEVVQQIPTAVSHQRQTVVHNHARVVTPIVAPAVRTVTSQIVRAYHTPLVYAPHVVEN